MNTSIGRSFLHEARFFLFILIAGLLSLTVSSCGGGGGGGGGSTGGGNAEDVGNLNSPAVIDQSNAIDLTIGAYNSQGNVPEIDLFASSVAGTSGSVGINDISQVVKRLKTRIESYAPSAGEASPNLSSSMEPVDFDPIHGTYGGTMTMTLSVDTENGDFIGSVAFSNYSEEYGIVESGTVNVSGSIDINSYPYRLSSMVMTFVKFSTTTEGDTVTMSGTVELNNSGNDSEMIMNLTAANNGEFFKFEDFTISTTEYYDYITMSIDGRFGTSEYGYVDFVTTENFVIYDWDDYPSNGTLVATGADGDAGGATQACLTVLSSTTYEVTADTDGNGSFDWDSGVLYWDEYYE